MRPVEFRAGRDEILLEAADEMLSQKRRGRSPSIASIQVEVGIPHRTSRPPSGLPQGDLDHRRGQGVGISLEGPPKASAPFGERRKESPQAAEDPEGDLAAPPLRYTPGGPSPAAADLVKGRGQRDVEDLRGAPSGKVQVEDDRAVCSSSPSSRAERIVSDARSIVGRPFPTAREDRAAPASEGDACLPEKLHDS